MVLYVLIALGIVVVAVIAVAVLGVNRFRVLWQALPPVLRTYINVTVAAAITWGSTEGVDAITGLDVPAWVKALLIGAVTALVKALNPADNGTPGYGIGAAKEGQPVAGAHEVGAPVDVNDALPLAAYADPPADGGAG